MGRQLYLNNFETTFIASVNPSFTTSSTELNYGVLRLSSGAAGALLNPTGGNYYLVTALKRSGSTETNIEIMKVTAVDNSVPGECRISVLRGQEGTPIQSFVSGDYVSVRWTRGSAENMPQNTDLANYQAVSGKDASGGYPGLTLFKLNLRNVANTITSWFTNSNTVARTYTLPDKDGTVAMTSDITGTNSGTNTGDETTATIKSKLGISTLSGSNTGDETTATIKSKLGISTLSGSNTGDETATTIGAMVSGAAAKTTPVDADSVGLSDSAASNVIKKFTWASLKAAVLSYVVATVNTWTKAQIGSPVALTVSANAVAVDLSLGNNFTLALQATTGQTLSNPTNVTAGQSGNIVITQNATPSTLAYGSYWKSIDDVTVAPNVSTTAGVVNVLNYYVVSPTVIWFKLNKGGQA